LSVVLFKRSVQRQSSYRILYANLARRQLVEILYRDLVKRSPSAFCREVVPTKPFTNTALYYKMMLESEPTPLLQNALGDFVVDQKPMSVTTK